MSKSMAVCVRSAGASPTHIQTRTNRLEVAITAAEHISGRAISIELALHGGAEACSSGKMATVKSSHVVGRCQRWEVRMIQVMVLWIDVSLHDYG